MKAYIKICMECLKVNIMLENDKTKTEEEKQEDHRLDNLDYSSKELEALANAHNLKSETTKQALEELLSSDPLAFQNLLDEHAKEIAKSKYKELESKIDDLITKSEDGQNKILDVLGVDYSQLPIHIRILVPLMKRLGFEKESEKLINRYKNGIVSKGLENYKSLLDTYIRKLDNKEEVFSNLCDGYKKRIEDYKDVGASLYSKLKSYHILKKNMEVKISELESDALELEEQGNGDILVQIQEEIAKARSDLDKIIKEENKLIQKAESMNRIVPITARQYMLTLKMRDIVNTRSQESSLYKNRLESLASFVITHNLIKDTMIIIKYINNIESVQQQLEDVIPPILKSIDELYSTKISDISTYHKAQEDLSKATARIAEVDEKRRIRAMENLDRVRRMRIPY